MENIVSDVNATENILARLNVLISKLIFWLMRGTLVTEWDLIRLVNSESWKFKFQTDHSLGAWRQA